MSTQAMTDLPKDAQFIGPDGHTHYKVTKPASEHERGWVEVDNLADGEPGFFAYSCPVQVEVVSA